MYRYVSSVYTENENKNEWSALLEEGPNTRLFHHFIYLFLHAKPHQHRLCVGECASTCSGVLNET